MDLVSTPAFDYGALGPDDGGYVQEQRDRIKVLARRSAVALRSPGVEWGGGRRGASVEGTGAREGGERWTSDGSRSWSDR